MGNCVTSNQANYSPSSGADSRGREGGGGGSTGVDTNAIEHHHPMIMIGKNDDDDDVAGFMELSSDFKVNLMVLLAVSKLQRVARRKKAYRALQLHQQWKLFSDLDTQDEAEMLNLAVFMQTLIEAIPPEVTPKSSTKESTINNFFGNSEFDGLGTIQLLSVDVSSKKLETLPRGHIHHHHHIIISISSSSAYHQHISSLHHHHTSLSLSSYHRHHHSVGDYTIKSAIVDESVANDILLAYRHKKKLTRRAVIAGDVSKC